MPKKGEKDHEESKKRTPWGMRGEERRGEQDNVVVVIVVGFYGQRDKTVIIMLRSSSCDVQRG